MDDRQIAGLGVSRGMLGSSLIALSLFFLVTVFFPFLLSNFLFSKDSKSETDKQTHTLIALL